MTVRFLPKNYDPALYGVLSATTNSMGNYVLPLVPNGTHTLTPVPSGYTFTPANKTITVAGTHITGQDFINSQ